ncbi:hypothetical protein JNUCC0626_08960 [Lentzea sp. JNUCC 0626]
MKPGPSRGGRTLPTSVSEYTGLDPFAAALALELAGLITARYGSLTGFLLAHMGAVDAPQCIRGDHENTKAFDAAMKAASKRVGRPAKEPPAWDFITYVLAACGQDASAHPRLAGLWLASQRYLPPGYEGPVETPEGAPLPYADSSEAPTDRIRADMLAREKAELEESFRQFRETHETTVIFSQRELQEVRADNEHRRDCERLLIRIIATQERRDRTTVEHELRRTTEKLAAELEEVKAVLTRETADHAITSNQLALVVACLDAVTAGGDVDPVLWLRDADFAIGATVYNLLDQPVTGLSRTAPEERFLAVFLRTYLLSRYGDAPDRDDTMGPYRSIVYDGVVPPGEVLEGVLEQHVVAMQVVQPLMAELTTEGPANKPELPGDPADVHTLEVPGGEDRVDAPEKQDDVVDLIRTGP